jgi:putative (di)nucleoside polyphosphate hydrolase
LQSPKILNLSGILKLLHYILIYVIVNYLCFTFFIMLDLANNNRRDGYRPNVGIILINQYNQVLLGRRRHESSWQFPQGGMKEGETPTTAMYRELYEEVGLHSHDVSILGHTDGWLYYDVPIEFIRPQNRGIYKGQKQIWYLLKLVVEDSFISLNLSDEPEFDAWLWCEYWKPLDWVISFKREVYQKALAQLSQYLPKKNT